MTTRTQPNAAPAFERLPPQHIDAEMSVLGAMLLGDKTRSEEAAEALCPADFYREAHGRIFASFCRVLRKGEPLDIVTANDALTSEGILEAVGGLSYLIALGEFVPTTASLPHYCRAVKRCSTLRRIIATAGELAGAAYLSPDDEGTAALVESAERQVLALRSDRTDGGPRRALDGMNDFLDAIEARQKAGGGLIGASTGYAALDWYTAGLQPGNLYLLAARPSMGKTSAAISIAMNLTRQGGTVAFFSLEMSEGELLENATSTEGMIDGHRMRLGTLTGEEWGRVRRATEHFGERLWIDETSTMTAGYIASSSRKIAAQTGGLTAIIVDYLQLIETGGTGANRVVELDAVSRALKQLSKEMNCPVIALAQLSRKVEMREDKRPMLSDLRESGGLEQDADVVIFLYRPSYYARKEAASEATERERFKPDPTEFIVAKNRKGQTGMARLGFIPAYRKFVEVAEEELLG